MGRIVSDLTDKEWQSFSELLSSGATMKDLVHHINSVRIHDDRIGASTLRSRAIKKGLLKPNKKREVVQEMSNYFNPKKDLAWYDF